MHFKRSLLLMKKYVYKKTLNCEHHGYSFKNVQKLGKISQGIFALGLVQSRVT